MGQCRANAYRFATFGGTRALKACGKVREKGGHGPCCINGQGKGKHWTLLSSASVLFIHFLFPIFAAFLIDYRIPSTERSPRVSARRWRRRSIQAVGGAAPGMSWDKNKSTPERGLRHSSLGPRAGHVVGQLSALCHASRNTALGEGRGARSDHPLRHCYPACLDEFPPIPMLAMVRVCLYQTRASRTRNRTSGPCLRGGGPRLYVSSTQQRQDGWRAGKRRRHLIVINKADCFRLSKNKTAVEGLCILKQELTWQRQQTDRRMGSAR